MLTAVNPKEKQARLGLDWHRVVNRTLVQKRERPASEQKQAFRLNIYMCVCIYVYIYRRSIILNIFTEKRLIKYFMPSLRKKKIYIYSNNLKPKLQLRTTPGCAGAEAGAGTANMPANSWDHDTSICTLTNKLLK